MKQAAYEPSTSTGKQSRSRLITVQQVINTLIQTLRCQHFIKNMFPVQVTQTVRA
uniref:Uncharacterized protein n=1 Tax=Arion vulgaris TaxID=1028688 RepID=A0A0B7A258_9EUPU